MTYASHLRNTGNGRVVGDYKRLVLATTVWYEIFAGFRLLRYVLLLVCVCFNFQNRSRKIYLRYLTEENVYKNVNTSVVQVGFLSC